MPEKYGVMTLENTPKSVVEKNIGIIVASYHPTGLRGRVTDSFPGGALSGVSQLRLGSNDKQWSGVSQLSVYTGDMSS